MPRDASQGSLEEYSIDSVEDGLQHDRLLLLIGSLTSPGLFQDGFACPKSGFVGGGRRRRGVFRPLVDERRSALHSRSRFCFSRRLGAPVNVCGSGKARQAGALEPAKCSGCPPTARQRHRDDALTPIVDYTFPARRRASACCSRTAPMNTCKPGTVSFPSSSIRSRLTRPEMVSGFWCRKEPPPNSLVSRRCSSLVSWFQCVVAGISRHSSDSRRTTKRDLDLGHFGATAQVPSFSFRAAESRLGPRTSRKVRHPASRQPEINQRGQMLRAYGCQRPTPGNDVLEGPPKIDGFKSKFREGIVSVPH
jgi:hypothetical protein